MDGLDLTGWVGRASTAETVQLVGLGLFVAAGIALLFSFLAHEYGERRGTGVAIVVSCIVCALGLIIGALATISLHDMLSDGRFTTYLADAYGLATLDCTLPDGYLNGMSDFAACTGQAENADITVKADVVRHYDLIIRNDRAYLYDENGDLLEVQR